jgi:hypothetical protein
MTDRAIGPRADARCRTAGTRRRPRIEIDRGVFALLAIPFLFLVAVAASAQVPDTPVTAVAAPLPPADVRVADVANDDGRALTVTWALPAGVDSLAAALVGVLVERGPAPSGPFARVDSVTLVSQQLTDNAAPRGLPVIYRLTAIDAGGIAGAAAESAPIAAQASWFNTGRTSVAVFALLFFGLVLYFLWSARSGKKLFVRRIPGIDAIEEAVGRATEMGRPVLYIPGIQDIDDIQTMASLTILESVARMTAQYDTRIIVPTNYPVVFTLAQEMVKNGYLQAGRPEAYDDASVRYVTTEQFAYVAAINGIILRDKPAANLFLGAFFAESLILAETGYATKAIQVAGTANVHQLPFFVVACDYTLIGEELYAASAYLSKEPRLLSTLKGSDYMKVIVIGVVVLGSLLESFGIAWLTTWMRPQ